MWAMDIQAMSGRVVVVVAGPVGVTAQYPHDRHVHHDPHQRDAQHGPAVRGQRMDEMVDSAEQDQPGQHQHGQRVRLGGQNLGATEAEGHHSAGGARGQARGDQRHAEREGVGQHVGCVRQQRQRVGRHAKADLNGHEGHQEPQAGLQAPGVGAAIGNR
jgi:hypothetical protein